MLLTNVHPNGLLLRGIFPAEWNAMAPAYQNMVYGSWDSLLFSFCSESVATFHAYYYYNHSWHFYYMVII